MARKITHILIFIFVVGVVVSAFTGTNENDDTQSVMQLPALILAGVYLGVLFVLYILPAITDKATTAVLDSGELVEKDPLHDARAAYARGEYDIAMEVYRKAASNDPYNRLPWVEIAKIQHDNLDDPDAAIATLRSALESHEWPINDAAYFMARLSDLYLEDKEDVEACQTILNQMIEMFPETRHSANARHKLNEIERSSAV